jgi:hypothetical protein
LVLQQVLVQVLVQVLERGLLLLELSRPVMLQLPVRLGSSS